MKNYLELVPISAKVHRRQNRMSVFCIVLSVFLITVIFGMADMFIRSQILMTQKEDGCWHITIRNISDEEAEQIAMYPEVESIAWYDVLNFRGDLEYTLSGKNVIIVGSDENYLTDMTVDIIAEGTFPLTSREALVSENARKMLGLKVGDTISVYDAGGRERSFTVSGFGRDAIVNAGADSYYIFLERETYRSLYSETRKEDSGSNGLFFVQFSHPAGIRESISDIKEQFGLSQEQISENTKLLGLIGQSGDSFMLMIYGAAAILFVLVLLAGVLMVMSSLNSNVAQRTEFFGMIRCIGATPKQIMRLVRREALGWCRVAIPVSVAAGTIVIWLLGGVLRFLSPQYFGAMPVFGISLPAIAAGVSAGILTVLFAAQSPGKRASRVSPLAAVTGNANDQQPVRRAANTTFFKVETALGIHHAKAGRKNLLLVAGSFALSIILFLGFSVTIDFMNQAITPLSPWTPDISIVSSDSTCSVDDALLGKLTENPAVKRVYGRMFAYGISVTIGDSGNSLNCGADMFDADRSGAGAADMDFVGTGLEADLISYEETQFAWAEDYILEGSVEDVKNIPGMGMVVYDVSGQQNVQVGDTVTFDFGGWKAEIQIAAMVSQCPFHNDDGVERIICSEDTFRELTGETNYTVIDIQMKRGIREDTIDGIHQMVGTEYVFSDRRRSNESVRGAYYSFGMFLYGFLILIAMITLFNIVNCIAMSVAARMKQYGTFRAVGLSSRQLAKMIMAEAVTYAVAGSFFGGVLGIVLNKILFTRMVTFRWGTPWTPPLAELAIIVAIVAVSVLLAVQGPVRRIRGISIVDTISAR